MYTYQVTLDDRAYKEMVVVSKVLQEKPGEELTKHLIHEAFEAIRIGVEKYMEENKEQGGLKA